MFDSNQKEIIQQILQDEKVLYSIQEKCLNHCFLQLRTPYVLYLVLIKEEVRNWAKHPYDVSKILPRSAQILKKKEKEDALDALQKCHEMMIKEICKQINYEYCHNIRYRMKDYSKEIPDVDILDPQKLFDYSNEYHSYMNTVKFYWEKMLNPDSIFEDANSLYIDMMGALERYSDGENLFSDQTELFFGNELGKCIYQCGKKLNEIIKTLREDKKKYRIVQAETVCSQIDLLQMQLISDLETYALKDIQPTIQKFFENK